MLESAHFIILAPLAASVLTLAFGRRLPQGGAFIGIAAMLYGFIHSLAIMVSIYQNLDVLLFQGLSGRFFERSMTWFQTGIFRMELGVLIDGLSSVMLVVVTFVALLVLIYSLGYQHDKPNLNRYYSYLCLFTFAMLLLVAANNMLQFFIGWELVGLCSYLLIGFEFEREAAAYAGRKAFLTTKVGDLGFYIGLLLLFSTAGTFNIPLLDGEHVAKGALSPSLCGAIALLLFCGAVGKSAQVPLHVWLPDAMEGPTPVSALMHAATMVAAGVYMVARLFFLYQAAPMALSVVAWIGVFTAFFTATMALVATDIKRVLAFSTISQLGYMMLGLGCGNVSAGMFHLTTHACFKALLFLGAGSVIHAVHTNDIWKMGKLSSRMPVTFSCFAVATLAISGMPGFSGFFSKDEILEAAYATNPLLFLLGLATAGLTAFYMFRLTYATFLAEPSNPDVISHAHESEPSMTVPLVLLAIPSALLGFALKYAWPFEHWVSWGDAAARGASPSPIVPTLSIVVFILGGGLAWTMYVHGSPNPASLAKRFSRAHRILTNRYYIDEFYLALIDRLVMAPAKALANFDYNFLDQLAVDGVGALATRIARAKAWFDDHVVDGGMVDGTGRLISWAGQGLKLFQNGFAQFYLLVMISGVGALILWAVRTLLAG